MARLKKRRPDLYKLVTGQPKSSWMKEAALEFGTGLLGMGDVVAFPGKIKRAVKPRRPMRQSEVKTMAELSRIASPSKRHLFPVIPGSVRKIPKALKVKWGSTDIPIYEQILKNPEYFAKNKQLKSKIEFMSPDEYLKKQAHGKGVSLSEDMKYAERESVEWHKSQMRQGKEIRMASLEPAKGYQEGRHRAIAAKELGVEKMPVQIIEEIK